MSSPPRKPPDLERGNRIRELREKQNLTQRQLAEIVGRSDRTVSLWERGHGTGGSVEALALALKTTPRYISRGETTTGRVPSVDLRSAFTRLEESLEDRDAALRGDVADLSGRLGRVEAQLSDIRELLEVLVLRRGPGTSAAAAAVEPQPNTDPASDRPAEA